jgi:hypothetical protein
MVIHPMFNTKCLKLYEPLMLDNDEEKYIMNGPKKLVVEVGTILDVDTVLQYVNMTINMSQLHQ